MKLALRTREHVCDACAATVPGSARWCGSCGDWLEGATAQGALGVPRRPGLRADDAPRPAPSMVPVAPVLDGDDGAGDGQGWHGPSDARAVGRRRVGAVALVSVATLVAGLTVTTAGQTPQSSESSLVGALDDASGRSSVTPPGEELGLLWRRPVETDADPGPPQVPTLLDETHLLAGGAVLDTERGTVVSRGVPVPGADGRSVLVEGGQLLLVDPLTGAVLRRAEVSGTTSWAPTGEMLGRLDDAVVLAGVDGRVAAVELDADALGQVRWVQPDGTEWRPGGDGQRVVVRTASTTARPGLGAFGVVDGRDGTVVRVGGDADRWDDQVVVGEVLVARTRQVLRGWSTDTGELLWEFSVPNLLGDAEDITLARSPAGVVAGRDGLPAPVVTVAGRAAGGSTTAAWVDVRDGTRLGSTIAGGVGRGAGGWPVAGVSGTDLVHADPVRGEVRALHMSGRVRWSMPVEGPQGLVVGTTHALLWSGPPPGGTQGRLRLLELATGTTVWESVDGSGVDTAIAALVDGQIVVRLPADRPRLQQLSAYELEKGRRRNGLDAVTRASGSRWARSHPDAPFMELLGTSDVDGDRRPVTVLLADGAAAAGPDAPSTPRLVGPHDRRVPLPLGFDASTAVAVGESLVLGQSGDGSSWSIDPAGEVTSLPGVHPLAAASGLLIARVEGGPGGAPGSALAGVRVSDGRVMWRTADPSLRAVVRSAGDALVVASTGSLVRLDPNDGTERWRVAHDLLAAPHGTVVHDERVDVLGVDGRVRSFGLLDGEPLWTSPSELGGGRVLTGAGDVTLVGTEGGSIVLLDADGAVVRTIDAGRDPVEDVVVVDGRIVATVGADLVAFGPGAWFVEQRDTVRLP